MSIGWSGALFIVFLVLKLTGVVAWSWWWVTAPLWIGFLLWLAAVAFVAAFSDTTPKTRYPYRRR